MSKPLKKSFIYAVFRLFEVSVKKSLECLAVTSLTTTNPVFMRYFGFCTKICTKIQKDMRKNGKQKWAKHFTIQSKKENRQSKIFKHYMKPCKRKSQNKKDMRDFVFSHIFSTISEHLQCILYTNLHLRLCNNCTHNTFLNAWCNNSYHRLMLYNLSIHCVHTLLLMCHICL